MVHKMGEQVKVPSLDLLTLLFDSEYGKAKEDTQLHAEAGAPTHAYTKAEARIITRQIAHWLRSQYGIGKGIAGSDVLVTFSNGQAGLPLLFYGIVAAEGIYSAAAAMLPAEALAGQIRDGPGKLLVCSDDLRETAVKAADIAGMARSHVLVLRTVPHLAIEAADGSATWTSSPEMPQLPWRVLTDPQDLQDTTICLVYTSGTTGKPKAVRISHSNMVSEAFLPAYLNRPIWDSWATAGKLFETRTIAHLGCSHISGVQGYFVNPFYDGGIVYWMSKFDFPAFLMHNSALKITTFFSLPRIFSAVAFHPAVTTQLSNLRIAYSGGWPLDPRVCDCTKLGGDGDDRALLSQTWGATETTGAVTHMPPDRRDKTGSVGILLPNMQLRLLDAHGDPVAPGQPGEAWLKGPVISRGYHNNPDADALGFKDGWYRTGDIVELKDDLVYVLGRKKEMIMSQNQMVPPTELESILIQFPGIVDAAVLGVSDGRGDVAPRALLVLGPGVEGTERFAQKIQDFVGDRVQDHKKLRGGVSFVQEIPRLGVGKICREKLPQLLEK